jgi:hypothetical protein
MWLERPVFTKNRHRINFINLYVNNDKKISAMKKPASPCGWRVGGAVGTRVERVKGIEPSYEAWEAAVLPLNYTRVRRIVVFSCQNSRRLETVQSGDQPMSSEDLRDRNGNLLGRITTQSDGRMELRDRNGNLKGHYNPSSNETRDRNGNLVARGNMLVTLL